MLQTESNYGWKGKVKTLQEHRREQFKIIQGGIGKLKTRNNQA